MDAEGPRASYARRISTGERGGNLVKDSHSVRTAVQPDPLRRLLVHHRILIHQPPGTEEIPHGQPVLLVRESPWGLIGHGEPHVVEEAAEEPPAVAEETPGEPTAIVEEAVEEPPAVAEETLEEATIVVEEAVEEASAVAEETPEEATGVVEEAVEDAPAPADETADDAPEDEPEKT